MDLFLTIDIGGLVLLIVSSFAVVWNRRVVVRDRPAPWQWLWRRRWQVGLLLGLIGLFSGYVKYPATLHAGGPAEGSFIRGIPFAVGGGTYGVPEDDPSPLAVITWQLNFLFWLLIPQFVLWATSRSGRKSAGAAPAPSPVPGQESSTR